LRLPVRAVDPHAVIADRENETVDRKFDALGLEAIVAEVGAQSATNV